MKKGWLVFIVSALLAGPSPAGGPPGYPETMARYLGNLTQFVYWPVDAFGEVFSKFTFGVIGDEAVSKELAEAQGGKWFNGHPVRVRSLKRFEKGRAGELAGCDILFIASSQKEYLSEILELLKGKPVLTVSDMEGFAGGGGMVQFKKAQGRITLKIDPAPFEKGRLGINAKLMQVAREVGATGPK